MRRGGNRKCRCQAGFTYKYDAENRLAKIGGYTYTYDGDGNRVLKANSTSNTSYWRGPTGDALFESSLTGTNQSEYIFFNGQRIARRDLSSPTLIHYYFSDHLGTHGVVDTVSSAGTITTDQDIDYYPYGGVEHDFNPNVQQHYRFTGKERDTESGLDNFGARYDASSMGRFMTPDWAAKPTAVPYAHYGNPQSLNLYSYVENNPTTLGDPDGHVPWSWGGGGGDCPDGNTVNCQGNRQQQWMAEQSARAQTAAQNTAQVPTSLHVESATDMTRSNPAMNYGIFIDVKYQVLDQNGKPMQSDKMQPMENGTFGDGTKYSGPIVSKKADENHTQSDGTFHDKPVGDVHPRQPTDPIKIQQNITIVVGDKEYKVRTQTYTVTSGGYGKGRIVNDVGDIDVTRP